MKMNSSNNDPSDPWRCSCVQAEYYFDFFMKFASKPADIVNGNNVTKDLFEKSKLSQDELCLIWELGDLDKGTRVILFKILYTLCII